MGGPPNRAGRETYAVAPIWKLNICLAITDAATRTKRRNTDTNDSATLCGKLAKDKRNAVRGRSDGVAFFGVSVRCVQWVVLRFELIFK